jgi:aryl-alcohol dehydrogenase (NADP+)
MMQTEFREETLQAAQKLREHAEAHNASPAHVAIGWVLNNRMVTGVIGGPRTEEQWRDYLDALSYRFTPEDEALIGSLVAPGHPAAPGYNDPAYPIEGRVPRAA